MRAISLYQPYASGCVNLADNGSAWKQYETRSWETKVRGLVAIHATKAFPKWCKELLREDPIISYALRDEDLPLGVI